jgi:hypothetical protein
MLRALHARLNSRVIPKKEHEDCQCVPRAVGDGPAHSEFSRRRFWPSWALSQQWITAKSAFSDGCVAIFAGVSTR